MAHKSVRDEIMYCAKDAEVMLADDVNVQQACRQVVQKFCLIFLIGPRLEILKIDCNLEKCRHPL